MKTIQLIAGAFVMILASQAGAGQQQQTSAAAFPNTKQACKAATSTLKQRKDSEVLVTGSMIPRKVRRNGMITAGISPVAVIDRRSIELSGARDVAEALKRGGLNR